MKLDALCALLIGCLLFILILNVPLTAADVTEFQVDSTDLEVYRDGLVRVTQTLTVNETLPAVSLPLLNSSVDNLIVLDENQTVLDYEVTGINLTVFTLGTKSVSLQYDTHSLTKKDFEVWTLIVDTPYNLTVLLPSESSVVYLSEIPTSIDMEGNKITLSLFPSQWEISYVLPLSPPAEFQISNLEVAPTNAEIGEEITISVTVTNVGEQAGSYDIPLIINQTVESTRTVTLEKDKSTTATFTVTKQTPGTYDIEIAGLLAQFKVNDVPTNGAHLNPIPTEYLIAVAIVVTAIVLVAYFLFRRRGVNVEKIFKMHPQLNKEEKDVIQFLAESEGKAFESKIRERFPDIPRTSLWRLVKRLEKQEIVKVKKIGLENRVELKN